MQEHSLNSELKPDIPTCLHVAAGVCHSVLFPLQVLAQQHRIWLPVLL